MVKTSFCCLGQITKNRVFETLDVEIFEEVGLVPKADLYRKKEIRMNTRLSYTQFKCDPASPPHSPPPPFTPQPHPVSVFRASYLSRESEIEMCLRQKTE